MKFLLKTFLAIAIFLSILSCNFDDQKIKFNPNLNLSSSNSLSNLGAANKIQIEVFDKRTNKEIIGEKIIGNVTLNIKNEQDLSALVKDKISQTLKQRNFVIDDNANKILEIDLIDFDYQAKRGFFIGHSKAQLAYKITVKNKETNDIKYQQSYRLGFDRDHFIMPLEKTDNQNLNLIFQEMLQKITSNNDLLVILTIEF